MIHKTHAVAKERVGSGFGNTRTIEVCTACRAQEKELKAPCSGSIQARVMQRLRIPDSAQPEER